ncbi:MAG: hypothetical protein ACOCZ8_05570, partial [Bacteroidota bacterium]
MRLLQILLFSIVAQMVFGQYQPELDLIKREGWSMETVGKTHTGMPIYMLTNADERPRPTLAIVTGYSRAYAGLGTWLLSQLPKLSKDIDYIVFPNASPEVMQNLTDILHVEQSRSTSLQPIDDDLDGETDEDGPEDLNGDGRISLMRVEQPGGGWVIDEHMGGLHLRRADPNKGEVGDYLLLTEGIDNDKDGRINEDPKGGVVFNMNFTHNFAYGSEMQYVGPQPVSSPEARAVA